MRHELRCPECKGNVLRRLHVEYMSREELGRPRGAKGEDVGYIFYECPNHGEVVPVEIEIPDWWEHLVGKEIAGITINGRGEGEDRYGNYLFTLPSTEPSDLAAWINAQGEEDYE